MNRWPTFPRGEFCQEPATLTKRQRRRCEHSTSALERAQDRCLKSSNPFACAGAGGKLLDDHGAEKRRRKRLFEKYSHGLGECLIAECVHEHVRVEHELQG